ncbi:MAG: protein-glutamate O-methyltransferase CheR [Desulfovibrio aminophilus]|uniref:CheR family methyltransferase n=1 Tax=Desulfovibrio aminophilus TaxID=81425 RepID=UPI0039EBBE43
MGIKDDDGDARRRAVEACSTTPKMSEADFRRFSQFITAELGIKLPPAKKTMLEARLQKRLRALGLGSHREYCEFLFSPQGMEQELAQLIDVVTTNTTHFFREPRHFEILAAKVIPDVLRRKGRGRVAVWSAGCSTGEEPYTLAMVLSECAEANPELSFSILATDISTQVLAQAKRAVYAEDRIEGIPEVLKRKYLLRSKDRSRRVVRMGPELRSVVNFQRLNFMREFDFREDLDIIFCRNVVIYFDRGTQEELFKRFCGKLIPGGYLFIGHSESLTGMDLPLVQVAPTVYRRT